MRTIRELAEELKISKEAIYKKIRHQLREELDGHVMKLDNVTQIDEDGQRIIIDSLNQDRRKAIEDILYHTVENGSNTQKQGIEPYNQLDLTTEYIDLLMRQLKIKDEQLQAANDHIDRLITQIGRQWLLRAERYETAIQLMEEMGNVPQKQQIHIQSKSILQRLFFKKQTW